MSLKLWVSRNFAPDKGRETMYTPRSEGDTDLTRAYQDVRRLGGVVNIPQSMLCDACAPPRVFYPGRTPVVGRELEVSRRLHEWECPRALMLGRYAEYVDASGWLGKWMSRIEPGHPALVVLGVDAGMITRNYEFYWDLLGGVWSVEHTEICSDCSMPYIGMRLDDDGKHGGVIEWICDNSNCPGSDQLANPTAVAAWKKEEGRQVKERFRERRREWHRDRAVSD
ncbi:hypothetical protein ACFQ9R_32840 [Nocardia sp. NPDC056541]|uniref:hypothetical protein n=1 Tax=Nocardia sp. NPDC056541 TaxID=3345860 RepID=UPI003670AFBB